MEGGTCRRRRAIRCAGTCRRRRRGPLAAARGDSRGDDVTSTWVPRSSSGDTWRLQGRRRATPGLSTPGAAALGESPGGQWRGLLASWGGDATGLPGVGEGAMVLGGWLGARR
jgi:hypothetical protein